MREASSMGVEDEKLADAWMEKMRGLMFPSDERRASMSAQPTPYEHDLAVAVLQLADIGGMPDTYWQTDKRIMLAREILDVPADGRYTHDHVWAEAAS